MKLQRDFTKSRRPLIINYGQNFKQIDLVLVKLYTNGSAHALVLGTWRSTHVYCTVHALNLEAKWHEKK
jgi:hypothetical protein